MSSAVPGDIAKVLNGAMIGTQFIPQAQANNARKRWIAYGLIPNGKLYLDPGAVKAICDRGKSLLAAGIARVEGDFQQSDGVVLCDAEDKEVARGIVNYHSSELQQIRGRKSGKFLIF